MAQRIQNLTLHLTIYDSPDDLSQDDRALLAAALLAANHSHSPYSQFKVGAALQLASGKILTAANQENMAYPAGQCAESICLFRVGVQYPTETILTLAVTTPSSSNPDELLTPCGVCRQVISEYRNRQQSPIRILMRGTTGPIYQMSDIHDLLPLMFSDQRMRDLNQSLND